MSPRAGMIVALLAAALLALAATGLSWWSGNPTLDGRAFHRKTAHIGLITASQCNFDDAKEEEYDCKHLAVGGSLAIMKFVQLGISGIAALALLSLAFAGERRRRGAGKLVLLVVAASSVMAVVLLAIGPNLKTGKSESMPIGVPWMLAFFGGTLLAIVSGVIAILPPRKPKPWVRTSHASTIPAQQPAFDVQALLAEDALRPASLGPEPMMGKPQSPGGMLPGPAGPLIPPSGPQPMFSTAPQLRPLYEAGASGGFVPPPPVVQFPVRGPTPMPHAAVSAALGLDAPPPPPPAPPPRIPPPARTKQASVAPPIPSIPPPPSKPASRPPPRAQPTITSAAVPPPRNDDPADRLSTVGYEKNLLNTGDNTSPNIPFDSSTSETATREFSQDDRTDAGEDLETNAIAKVDPSDVASRPSMTEVELTKDARGSETDVEQAAAPRMSSSIMTSAAPPSRLTPMPVLKKPTGQIKVPISTAPTSLPPPAETGAAGGPSPACPQCEAPMSWVEEHLRFYCKSCRMYF